LRASCGLWTRLSELSRSSKLTLEVAKDKHFRDVVKNKEVVAEGNRDFTVHQHVGGLKPGHEYFYRFATKHKSSRVGRFRTRGTPGDERPARQVRRLRPPRLRRGHDHEDSARL
jgi:alkaline phosphatase D